MKKNRKPLIISMVILLISFAGFGIIYYFSLMVAPLPKLSNSRSKSVKIKILSRSIEGEFTWRVNKYLNKETLVRYMVPLDPITKKPGKNAANIVFYAPYNGDARRIRQGWVPWHRYFAEQMGCTIFTLAIEANTQITDDIKRYYIYKESGWHDLILKLKEHLEKEYLLEPKPLLVIGESSGGSMAQQMAAAFPEKIAAAAWNGGTRFVSFTGQSEVSLLALNTWGCPGIPATKTMTEEAQKHHINILNAESFPAMKKSGEYEHHAASEFTHKMIQDYIKGIIKLRDGNNGVVPPTPQWPARRESDYFPSSAFAEAWNKLPRTAVEALNDKSDELIIFPAPAEPKAVVLIVSEPTDLLQLKDSLYFLYQNQVVPMTVLTTSDSVSDIRRIREILVRITQEQKWRNLPIILLGNKFAGQLAITAGLKYSGDRIKKIIAVAPEIDMHLDDLPVVDLLKTPHIPVEIFLSDKDLVPLRPTANLSIYKILPLKNDKDWFELLRRAIN